MKKTAIIFVSLLLLLCMSVSVSAAAVTTTPQESTADGTEDVYGDGMIYESDTVLPLAVCLLAVLAFIAYGVIKLKKTSKD